MLCGIIYSYLNFMNLPIPRHNNMKLTVKNHSYYNSISRLNNTYRRKNNPNEYGNLVAFLPGDLTAYSSSINKGVNPIVKRSRPPNMILGNVIEPIPVRNMVDYVVWACVFISLFVLPPPPPPPPPMTPILVTENRVPFWRRLSTGTCESKDTLSVVVVGLCICNAIAIIFG